jgi:hypothetical protein
MRATYARPLVDTYESELIIDPCGGIYPLKFKFPT